MKQNEVSREQLEQKKRVSAASIAVRALAEVRLAEAIRAEQEHSLTEEEAVHEIERRQQERNLQMAKDRLNRSPIASWFPEVDWDFKDHSDLEDIDVWQSGEDNTFDMVRLAVNSDFSVFFVTHKHDRLGARPAFGIPEPKIWGGVEVHSAADVGAMFERQHEALRSPDGAALSD